MNKPKPTDYIFSTRWGPLDLSLIAISDPYEQMALRETQQAFEQGDVGGLFLFMDNTKELRFVHDNLATLQKRGIYEAALVSAYIAPRTNHGAWRLCALEHFFRLGNCQKLLEAGEPLPAGDRFTLYRGVSGKVPYRKISGMSWTRKLDKAVWFALRYPKQLAESGKRNHPAALDPAVYKTVVARGDVLCYSNERDEDDFILRARRYKRLDLSELRQSTTPCRRQCP